MEIVCRNLSFIYQAGTPFAYQALYDMSLRIPSGCFAAVLGSTGSGKSTFVQLISGLLRPTTGSIQIGEQHITSSTTKLAKLRRKVGLVFQYPEYQLFGETVEKDIAFGPTNLGLGKQVIQSRVAEAMQLVGLPFELATHSPFLLSGGQKRKVAIAGVLALNPEVLVLDEPTVGLDPQSKREFLALIARIHRERKTTILLVTHEMDDVAAYAEYVYLLNQGQCIREGKPANIFTDESALANTGLDLPHIVKLRQQISKGLTDPLPDHIMTLNDLVRVLDDRLRKGGSS